MAVTISGYIIKSKLIRLFTKWFSDELDPCFAALKRIDRINVNDDESYSMVANLQLIAKTPIRIDFLYILNKRVLSKMKELCTDKDVNFIIDSLQISYSNKDYISDEDAEFIKKISPKMFTINWNILTVNYIKTLALLNCTNIEAKVKCNRNIISSYLWFIKTPIQLFDFKSDQRQTFEWESIKFYICKNKINKVKLVKANTGNYLFIPLYTIRRFFSSGFREIRSADNISQQFAEMEFEHEINTDWFIVPLWYSNRASINISYIYLDCLTQIVYIYRTFKQKHIQITTGNLGWLLKIKKQLPNDFTSFNFKYIESLLTEIPAYSISEIMADPDWSNLKLLWICQKSMLSPDELQFWCKMLQCRKTRFSITSINLEFSLLSECLTVLSLCSACPELESVKLQYLEADEENEHEEIENAEREFRQKFGFIQKFDIWKVIK